MDELARITASDLLPDEDQRKVFAAMYLLKKIDLKPEDGGMEMPVVLPSELSPIDDLLADLAVEGLLEINAKKGLYELTKQGLAYLGELIDEAEALVEEFDDDELAEVVAELRRRNLDVFRARFLWGWYEGEFDDLVQFQRQRGVTPVETMWAFYLMSPAFFDNLARELQDA